MSRFFTHYWSNSTWNTYRDEGRQGEQLDQIASNQFRKRGIGKGDKVYVVSVFQGTLFLCAALEVAKVCDRNDAAQELGCLPEDLWEADDQILAFAGTTIDFDRLIPPAVVKKLQFIAANGNYRPPTCIAEGILDSQTLRGVRELTVESATLLNEFLPLLEYIPLKRPQTDLTEEVMLEDSYYEGMVRQVLVNDYERDPKVRRMCIAYYGPVCFVCDFDFSVYYGLIGEGFIHVHHLTPLSEVGAGHSVNPVADMRPVCPNCHAMLHQRTPPFTTEELQAIMKEAREKLNHSITNR